MPAHEPDERDAMKLHVSDLGWHERDEGFPIYVQGEELKRVYD
jgi:hypothetical protein